MTNFVYGIVFISFLVFVGWVFTITASPWAFVLLIFMPSYTHTTDDKKNIESKKETTKNCLKNE